LVHTIRSTEGHSVPPRDSRVLEYTVLWDTGISRSFRAPSNTTLTVPVESPHYYRPYQILLVLFRTVSSEIVDRDLRPIACCGWSWALSFSFGPIPLGCRYNCRRAACQWLGICQLHFNLLEQLPLLGLDHLYSNKRLPTLHTSPLQPPRP
jgi:hypothetical protein